MNEIILGLYPQSEEEKPFAVVNKNNQIVEEILPEDFWQHTADAMRRKPQDIIELEGEQ